MDFGHQPDVNISDGGAGGAFDDHIFMGQGAKCSGYGELEEFDFGPWEGTGDKGVRGEEGEMADMKMEGGGLFDF